LGSEYGGFYVSLEKANSISNLLSFGIGNDISFDLEFNKMTKCKVYMFDPTEGVENYISDLHLNSDFKFYPIGISDSNTKTKFYKPINSDHISHSLVNHENTSTDFYYSDFKKWETICEELSISNVDVLKMDIEGSEFQVIPDIFKSNIFPTQICVEMHPRFIKNGIVEFFKLLRLFRINNYNLMAINNSGNEFLFIINNR
jgi:FkbM family methyltransferase